MILHPDLRALRSDDAPQRHAQAAMQAALDQWRGHAMTRIAAELDDFAQGRDLSDCPALAPLFGPGPQAARFAGGFARAMARALRRAPLGHVPQRHFTNGVTSTLLLASRANATLALVAVDGAGLAQRPLARTADFSPTRTWEHVLAGRGEGERIERPGDTSPQAALRRTAVALAPGYVSVRDGIREALQIRAVRGGLVFLRLQRRAVGGEPTREYALADGRLVHQAASDPSESRVELMMALLGRMGRVDAAPLMADIARGRASPALRWQGLRECLALDTLKGFVALDQVARDAADPLGPAAGALRARLVESHPQLGEIARCRA